MDTKKIIGGAVAIAAIAAAAYYGTSKAKAADMGGSCCSDLEDRIAELEATTARKGNRKVSLEVSGYVSHSVMMWDDGGLSDTYIGDGGAVSSRFRFTGKAKMTPNLTAGFTYEFGINNNALGSMTQGVGGDDLGGAVSLRDSTVWMRHKNLGMVKIGHGSTATDNLILVDLSGAGVVMTPDVGLFNGNFGSRISSVSVNGTPVPIVAGLLTPLTWGQIINGGTSFDTARRNHVLYESPSLAGFTLQASVAENEFWDVALRYAGEFGGFRFAAGIGHSVDKEAPTFGPFGLTATDMKETKGSASLMHVNSGLFVNVAAGMREIGWSVNAGLGHTLTAKDATFWHVGGGWSKNIFGIGNTILFAEYMNADDFLGYSLSGPIVNGSTSSEAAMWGVGIVQKVDAAAMELFLSYKRYEADLGLTGAANGGTLAIDAQMHDFSAVIGGARISF